MPLISTRALTKRYPGGVMALDGLSVEIEPGVIGLVGANGAGKSTLLKILLGLLPATAGEAHVLDLDTATQGARIRELVGYMPEHDCLPPDLSATDGLDGRFVADRDGFYRIELNAPTGETSRRSREMGLHDGRVVIVTGAGKGLEGRSDDYRGHTKLVGIFGKASGIGSDLAKAAGEPEPERPRSSSMTSISPAVGSLS